MARPREFDSQDALEKAMDVFWAEGYEAASLADLIAAMGISKSSFYDTYGSKHELLLSALDHYNETVGRRATALILEHPEGPKAGIAAALNSVLKQCHDPGGRRGCLIGNCAVELAPHDPAVAARVRHGGERLEDAFFQALRRGQALGEIPKRADARALARFLTCSLNGLAVMAKATAAPGTMEDAVRVALSTLD